MTTFRQTCARLMALFRKRELDRDLDEELAAHVELATQDYVREGLSAAEARRLALIKLGGLEPAKEEHRDARALAWLDGMAYDLRYGIRGLIRDRLFTLAMVMTLTLAVGVNLTAFRVMSTMLYSGFPLVKENDRLLYVEELFPGPGCCVSYMDFEVWRDQAHSFESMAFGVPKNIVLSQGDGNSKDMSAWAMTANTFAVLGVRPVLGRDFSPSDEVPGAPLAVIISHEYWQAQMAGSRDIIGRIVRINDAPATIVGVLPRGFEFFQRESVWLPLQQTADLHRVVANGGSAFGRLAKGASEAGARAEVEAINQRLAQERPATNRNVYPVVRSMQNHAGPKGPLIYGSVWAGAWIVLLIACANLANLTLARTQGRTRELSTRMALGAGRSRVIRQLVLENFVLTASGGVLGWWAANWATRAWELATASPNQVVDYSAGIGTVAYLIGVSLSAAALITLAPIVRLWRVDLNGELKGESRGTTVSRAGKGASRALVALQMALAIVLIGAAGVLGRSLWNVLASDVGVKAPEHVLVGRFNLPRSKYATAESRLAFAESLQSHLAAVPGVESAGVSNAKPAADFEPHRFEWEPQIGAIHGAPTFAAGPGYFQTIGVSLLAGRDFTNADRPNALPVMIVNQRFAETYFPGQNAVGQRIRFYEKRQMEPEPWRMIVGVVSNINQNDWTRQHFLPAAYLPIGQDPVGPVWFFARANQVNERMAAALRKEVHDIDRHLELLEYSTLKESLGFGSDDYNYRELARHALVAPIYAIIALFLAAFGLYAVIAHSVSLRTKEIGVRMALGGAARDIRLLLLREGLRPVFAGMLIGLAASLGVNRVIQSQLVGVSPHDPLTLTMAPLLMLLVGLLGCLLPARRATRVDPMAALRHD